MSSRQPSLSIVEYFAEHSGYRCGYCGQEDTNYSHGMWGHTLTTEDYQVGPVRQLMSARTCVKWTRNQDFYFSWYRDVLVY